MNSLTIYRNTGNPCPHCGHMLNAAVEMEGGTEPPQQGDLSICIQCGNVLEFDNLLRRRSIPLDRLRTILEDMPDLREALRRWADAGPMLSLEGQHRIPRVTN